METCTETFESQSCSNTEFSAALGTAFAISSYAEMFVTALVVVAFTQTGIIYMKRSVTLSVLFTEPSAMTSDPELQEEITALKEQVALLRSCVPMARDATAPAVSAEVGVVTDSSASAELLQQSQLQPAVVLVSASAPQQPAQTAFCPGCGAPQNPGARFCKSCGKPSESVA